MPPFERFIFIYLTDFTEELIHSIDQSACFLYIMKGT